MKKSWAKCENGNWINLEHCYRIFLRSQPNEEGFWELCASFTKPDTSVIVISSYESEQIGKNKLDEIMQNFQLSKNNKD